MVAFGSERLLSAASIWACSVGHSLASAGPAAAAATTRAMTKLFISLPPWGLSTGPSDRMFVAIGTYVKAPIAHEPSMLVHGRSLPNTRNNGLTTAGDAFRRNQVGERAQIVDDVQHELLDG